MQDNIHTPSGMNEINGLSHWGAKAAAHLPVESAFTALQSVPPGNSRVVHGGFGVPVGEYLVFLPAA
jgi:hypothetical protein